MFPSAKTREDWVWFGKVVVIILVVLAGTYGLVMGSFLLYELVLSEAPDPSGEIPFKDVLLTVLAIAAVFVGTFGAGVYALLFQKIQRDIVGRTERTLELANATNKINVAMLYWSLFQQSDSRLLDQRRGYLDTALQITVDVYDRVSARIDVNDREGEKIMTMNRNNWAYYLYELDLNFGPINQIQRETALACLEYIQVRKTKYSDLTSEILDTITKTASRNWPAV